MDVVELKATARRASDPTVKCFYVGETALTPEERFEKHMSGVRAARVVHRHGKRLRPDLVAGVGPFATRTEALHAEAEVAARLRAKGYVVFGGQGESFMARLKALASRDR